MTKSKNEILVEEIHNTFNIASEKLLANAQEILNQSGTIPMEKAERLKAIGFVNANEVKKWDKIKMTKELADRIRYYQMAYPMNKFITEEQVKMICKKYNLVCAPVNAYSGFVPETKLKQIENFQIKKQDEKILNVKISCAWNTGVPYGDFLIRTRGGSHIHNELGMDLIPVNHPALYWMSGTLFSVNVNDNTGYVTQYKVYGTQQMLICAPKKDMNLKGLEKVGAIFTSFVTVDVPDPVVLQPCNGGYLIVAAWGDEASDEIVVNPIHN